jgi:S-methylmethionine-dependent homocysteine/selenocysteine methylase
VVRHALPQLSDEVFLTDSGIETDLIFHGGWDLPEFAAFRLLDDAAGIEALRRYYLGHIEVAATFDRGLILEAATWRASRVWGEKLGYSREALRTINRRAIELLADLRRERGGELRALVVSGCIGPSADAYRVQDPMTAADAEAYHREQVATFAGTDADLVHAMTLTHPAEAIGIARAAVDADIPVVISFTTETDGRLPDGTGLAEAIDAVETATDQAPVYYGINCAHPTHFAAAFPPDQGAGARIRSLRANASRSSHAEIDEAEPLDAGDPVELAGLYEELRAAHPRLSILGGCCGTDVRHVEAIAAACR